MHMATDTKSWTLEELHRLPDDGNKYELIHGELYVTPAPTNEHETVLARLTRILEPYVAGHQLGFIYHPRAVFRIEQEVEVEPDLMVRAPHPEPHGSWESAPLPLLVVEVISPTTRRRDRTVKRELYRDEARIADYWIIDTERKDIQVVRPDQEDLVVRETLIWAPAGAGEPLEFQVSRLFG